VYSTKWVDYLVKFLLFYVMTESINFTPKICMIFDIVFIISSLQISVLIH
jgi:hypothetical protein